MGGAMLKGWLNSTIDAHYNIIEPFGKPDFLDRYSNATYGKRVDDIAEQIAESDICILAVKPQMMKDVCASLKAHISPTCLIASVAAGQMIANYESYFGESQPIVRVMPNTPAAIGQGMSVLCANPHANDAQKQLITRLLDCSGKTAWVDDEGLMNAVTAVSGSGPAYIFHFIEALAQAGEQAGLDGKTAMTLARQTVIGSAALAGAEESTPASTLRENVTSPNGTTAAALQVLMDGRFQDILNEAINAAKTRGEELAS